MSIHLSIIIPAYNEEDRLPVTLRKTMAFLSAEQFESEIIVVSDGSTDGTRQAVESFMGKKPDVRLIEYFPNAGKGAAVKRGMMEAAGDYRLFMDADYAVPIEFVSTFLSMMNHSYDIVIGSRGLKRSQIGQHQPFVRELAGKLFGSVQRVVTGLPFADTQCGFKLFTREAAEALFPVISFNCAYFDAELLYVALQRGMQVGEIGVRWSHDGATRLPIGIGRTVDLMKKLFLIKKRHGNHVAKRSR